MLNITKDGIIQLSRGDNCEMPLFINEGTDTAPIRYKYAEHPNTVVYLAVMQPNAQFEQASLRKMYTSKNWELNEFGDLVVKFLPKDTMYMIPGKYYYEIKVDLDGTGYINTVIGRTEFWVK